MLLEAHGLVKRFGGVVAVDAVDLAVTEGEVFGLIGPNGAGKTTLFGMICGRVPPSAGTVEFDGADITRLQPWDRVARGIVQLRRAFFIGGAKALMARAVLIIIAHRAALRCKAVNRAVQPGFVGRVAARRDDGNAYTGCPCIHASSPCDVSGCRCASGSTSSG